ncbi:hypothetical protein Taro_047982 [Colocasia esculenta]|uniref:Myb/SANT-like domain-containing protein n=1 Tax=Colocasia esculenta TaxID=4460 RepID=A0A843X1W6_COLES|nr:hypothetical protein [Colocasia esculenta]
MGNVIAAMERMKWSKLATLSEVSYPYLVKAFYVCLKTEEDGSLTSSVKDSSSRIEDIPQELIEPIGQYSEVIPPSSPVASVLKDVLDSEPVISDDQVAEAVASGHTTEMAMEKAPSQREQAVTHENVSVEDAPIEGEQSLDEEAAPQGEHTESIPTNTKERVELEEPMARAQSKRKRVAHRRPKEKQLKIQLKPIIKRLNEQGKTLTSLQSDIQSILISQTLAANEIGALTTEVHNLRDDFKMFKQLCRWMKGEFDSVKKLISSSVQSTSAPSAPSSAEPISSSRAPKAVAGPSGPSEAVVGPPGPLISEDVNASVVEPTVAPEAPESSTLATPAPPSPPSLSTTPPAPITFKQPMPRTISSPSPFPSQSTSSPTISPTIPLPSLVIEDPTVSSSTGASSSSGPSSAGPSTTLTPKSFLHPPTPPSSITFIPENPQLASAFLNNCEDELERTTLTSILLLLRLDSLKSMCLESMSNIRIFVDYFQMIGKIGYGRVKEKTQRKGRMGNRLVQQEKAVWNEQKHAIFVRLCLEQKIAGNKPSNTLNKVGYENLEREFLRQTGTHYVRSQLKNHWDSTRRDWQI